MKYDVQYTHDPAGTDKWELYLSTHNFGEAMIVFTWLVTGQKRPLNKLVPCAMITEDDYITTRYQAPPDRVGNTFYKANK